MQQLTVKQTETDAGLDRIAANQEKTDAKHAKPSTRPRSRPRSSPILMPASRSCCLNFSVSASSTIFPTPFRL